MNGTSATSAFGTDEVAKRLNCSERMVRKLVESGKLGYFKIGRDYRFTDEHVSAYIESTTVRPGAAQPESPAPSAAPAAAGGAA